MATDSVEAIDLTTRLNEGPPEKRVKVEESFAPFHINHLPEPVLRNIFSYLFTNDKLSASAVCRDWLEVLDDRVLLDGICIQLHQWQPKLWNLGDNDVYFSRKFSQFHFTSTIFSSEVLDFFDSYGENIKSLTLCRCEIEANRIPECCEKRYCCNLEKLQYIDCMFNIFPELPVLRHFSISSCVTENGWGLIKWGESMKKVESFELNLITAERDMEVRTERILRDVLVFVRNHVETLTEIQINKYDAPVKQVCCEIFQMKNLKLKKLSLHNKSFMYFNTVHMVEDIIKFPTLTHLELKFLHLKGDHLSVICEALPNLKSLYIKEYHYYQTHYFDVACLKQLQSLSICNGRPLETVIIGMSVCQMEKLKHFELRNANAVANNLTGRLQSMTNLRSLVLDNCVGFTDEILQLINRHLTLLRSLELSSDRITDRSIYCHDNLNQGLLNLKGLRTLKITSPNITAAAVMHAIKFLELHTLIVRGFDHAVPKFVVEEIKSNNPSLKNLYLGNKFITI